MRILDLGCGNRKEKGAVGIDISRDTKADIIWDLNAFPYPLQDDEFDIVICYDILEHLTDTVRVMEEIHRIAKPNALVEIRVPHYACWWGWSDPTHKKLFSPFSFEHFLENRPHHHYTKISFKLIRRKIDFHRLFKWTLIEFLANRFPVRYEQFFAYFIRPQNIHISLVVLKDSS